MSRSRVNDRDVSLHRVLTAWGEGASDADGEEGAGAAATTGDATWLYAQYATSTWSSAGGDFDPAVSAVTLVERTAGAYSWTDAQMVIDVQGWLDAPASNFGWVLVGAEGGGTSAKRFDSREHPFAPSRPVLTIDYTTPAAVPAISLASFAVLTGILGLVATRLTRARR